MSKDYDISKETDMRHFRKDLKNTLKENILNAEYEIECSCGFKFSTKLGETSCPNCGEKINLAIDYQD